MISPKKLFIIDGLSAAVSGLLASIIILFFDRFFGLSAIWFSIFIIIAASYACFSLTIAFTVKNWLPYLRILVMANIAYGLFTLSVIMNYRVALTIYDVLYFTGEVIFLGSLIFMELKCFAYYSKLQSDDKNSF